MIRGRNALAALAGAAFLLAGCAEPPPGPVRRTEPPQRPPERRIPPASPSSPGGSPLPAPPSPPPQVPLPAPDAETLDVILQEGGPRASVTLSFEGPGRIEQVGGPRILRAGDGLSARIEMRGAALLLDGESAGSLPLRAVGARGQGFLLDGKPYPGELQVTAAGRALLLVNRASEDDYLAGVLAGELFPDAPPESLRALTILARSFALSHLAGLTDDPGVHQAYRGMPVGAARAVTKAAVASTAGLRLLDAGGVALPSYWYHSTCGGHTAEASVVFGAPPSPAYAGVPCSKCTSSKYFSWEAEFTEEEIRKAIGFGSPVSGFEIARRSLDGRVQAFRATAAGGTVREIPAIQVRKALGPNRLRSTLLTTVEPVGSAREPRGFRVRGRGWGHGVGLCQIGAMTMAREGRTAEEILLHYYPGTRIAPRAR